MCNVLSFSQESTKERPGTSRMVPGLSRRLKGHILTFPCSHITDIAPLESPAVQMFLCPFGNPGGAMAYQELFGKSVPGLSRRLKGHIHTFPCSHITNIAPLESSAVQMFLCPFVNPGGAGIIHYQLSIKKL